MAKTRQRVLLIVEDDPVWNMLCKLECEEVFKELPEIEGMVQQAFSYEQARHFLQDHTVDFVSLDIALSKEEQGRTDQQRAEREVGGITFLKNLQENNQEPFVVVVTGETLQSYAIDAYREYGILTFYQKDRFNHEEYRNALKASLHYLDTADFIKKLEIEAALFSWEEAMKAAQQAGVKERNFENLGYKIKAIRDGLTHPSTGLPMGQWTDNKLKDKIVGHEENWALIRVVVRGFNQFVSVFPSQEKPILLFIAELLKQTQRQFQDEEIFIGHLGHRGYLSEPLFVVIPGPKSVDQAGEIGTWIDKTFAQTGSRPFAPAPELYDLGQPSPDQAEPTFNLDIKILPDEEYTYFSDLPFLIDTLGQLSVR